MIKALTQDHLRAFNYKAQTADGLLLRAEYCDFMSQCSTTPVGRDLWVLSGRRRREEAAAKRGQGQ